MVKRIVLAGLIIALVAGGVIATTTLVKAQAGTTGSTSTSTSGPTRPFDQFLAEELGITVERLQEARAKAARRALDQALADGKITQEQYDHMVTMQALRAYIDPQAILAEALGVSVEELPTKTLKEWMDAKGLDAATLKAQVDEVLQAKLDQAVADGVVTQEQIDALGEDFLLRGLERGLMFGGRGRGGMPGFPGRGRGRGGMPGFFGGDSGPDDDFGGWHWQAPTGDGL